MIITILTITISPPPSAHHHNNQGRRSQLVEGFRLEVNSLGTPRPFDLSSRMRSSHSMSQDTFLGRSLTFSPSSVSLEVLLLLVVLEMGRRSTTPQLFSLFLLPCLTHHIPESGNELLQVLKNVLLMLLLDSVSEAPYGCHRRHVLRVLLATGDPHFREEAVDF